MTVLSETVSLDGGILLILLLVFIALLALVSGGMWLGCVMATRAGRGSREALAVWAAIGAVEALLAVPGISTLNVVMLVPAMALVAQVFLYRRARRSAPPLV